MIVYHPVCSRRFISIDTQQLLVRAVIDWGSKLAAKKLRESRKDNWVKAVEKFKTNQKCLIKMLDEQWEEEKKKKKKVQ